MQPSTESRRQTRPGADEKRVVKRLFIQGFKRFGDHRRGLGA